MQTLAEFVHGDRNDLAQVLIHNQRHANTRVLEKKYTSAMKGRETRSETYLARFGIDHA
jgi:hypothetical protein